MLQSAIMLFKGHLPLLFQALFCPCQAVLFWTGNSDRKLLFKQRFGDKGQTRWDDVSTPSLRHGEVLCLCIPQRGILSFSLLLILSLFAVVLPWCEETGHCARETTVLCSIRRPIGRSANLSPTPEPWCFSKVSGQCELPISTCLVPRRGEVAGVGGCRHTWAHLLWSRIAQPCQEGDLVTSCHGTW